MNTIYLHEFVVLADTLNYLEAAEQLYMTQSALSKHIQALEKSLGVVLLNRTTRQVTLSDAGKILLPYARQIDAIESRCMASLEEDRRQKKQELELGSIPVMSQYRITELLSGFRRSNPQITLKITENDSQDLITMLTRGRCQLAFLRCDEEYAPLPTEMEGIRISEDRLAALVSREHPLAKRKRVALKELADSDFLLFQEHSQMHGFSVHACRKSGFSPRVSFNGRRPENLAELASRGLGTALLMRKQAGALASESVALLDLEPACTNEIWLCYSKARPLSPTGKEFLRYVEGEMSQCR